MVYFIGYKCPWEKYPVSKFLDGDVSNVKLRDPLTPEMQTAAIINKAHVFKLGYPVEAKNVPTIMQWTNRVVPTDYDTPSGFPCVSLRMKALIEQFEPDMHQFFPLKVVNKKKEQIEEHYLWVVCSRIDSVDREHTTMILRNGRTWTSEQLVDGKLIRVVKNPKLVFSRKQTEGYHFWRDPFLMGGGVYASDEAGKTLIDAKLTGLGGSLQETI